MNKQKLYISTLSIVFFVSLLTAQFLIPKITLDIYLTILSICYFGTTLIFRQKRRDVDLVGVAFLMTLSYFALIKVLGIVS